MLSFVRRFELPLSVFSALVVLFAFFAKGLFTDRITESKSALTAAVANYNAQIISTRLSQQVTEGVMLQERANLKEDGELRQAFVTDHMALITSEGDLFNAAVNLIAHLPYPVSSLKEDQEGVAERLANVRRLLDAYRASPHLSVSEAEVQQINQIDVSMLDLSTSMKPFGNKVGAEAKEQSDKETIALKRARLLEWVVFSVGWGLGLLTTLAKLSGPAKQVPKASEA